MKINKTKLIITSLIILLPMLVGLILWNVLPELMDTHWGASGQVDGRGGKGIAVFVLPLVMLITHLLCMFATHRLGGNENQSPKALNIIYWICPVLSVYCSAFIYAVNLGVKLNVSAITFVLLGVTFIVIGNYMPKMRRNPTLGIKLKWTLSSEANWNATHRFAGKLWTAVGVVMLFGIFIPLDWMIIFLIFIITLAVIVPTVYSYRFYKRELSEGKTEKAEPVTKHYSTKTKVISGILLAAVLVFTAWIMLSGNVSLTYFDEGIEVRATLWGSRTIKYEDIDSVELADTNKAGAKINGVNTARINAGWFENSDFGHHDRYAYTKADSSVVIYELDGDIIVISLSTDEENREMYDTILTGIGGGKQ